jgi:hypothetical protein
MEVEEETEKGKEGRGMKKEEVTGGWEQKNVI